MQETLSVEIMIILAFAVAMVAAACCMVAVACWLNYRNKRNEDMFLRAVNILGQRAHGFNVADAAGISILAVYLIGDRLERKGLVASERVPGGAERGGKAKKVWSLTQAGRDAIA